jgi:circadian clock protein KaiC
MAHSNQIREFILSADGIRLREAYVGRAGVLTGSARLAQEAEDKAAALVREQEMQRRSRNLERKRREITAQIEALQAQLASEVDEETVLNREGVVREDQLTADRAAMGKSRHVAAPPAEPALKAANRPKGQLEKRQLEKSRLEKQ